MNSDIGITLLALIHFFSYGLMLYINHKQAKKINTIEDRNLFVAQVSFYTILTLLVIVLIIKIVSAPFINTQLNGDLFTLKSYSYSTALLAIMVGVLFYFVSVLRLIGQKSLPSYVFFPIYRSSILIAIISGYFIFDEQITSTKVIACIIIFLSVSFFWSDKSKKKSANYVYGIIITLASTVIAAITQTLSKVLLENNAEKTTILDYVTTKLSIEEIDAFTLVFGSNLANLTICLIVLYKIKPALILKTMHFNHAAIYSGILNCFAFLTLNMYLIKGDMSVIYPIGALSIIIPTIIMQIRHEEEHPSNRQANIYILSIFAIILLLAFNTGEQ